MARRSAPGARPPRWERAVYDRVAIPADSSARTIVFAMSPPDAVNINDIPFGPTAQDYQVRQSGLIPKP
ncbi:hypothetical protein C1D09_008765 [Mesorhizobium intechi]|nr:hypothetical protein C1D09_008765 [Mesorhizobium intechi]